VYDETYTYRIRAFNNYSGTVYSDYSNEASIILSETEFSVQFTNCGNTGSYGPSQSQVNTAYSGTELEGQVTVSSGIQYWTVPYTTNYTIEVWGASGSIGVGGSGGNGARMKGEFNLQMGDVLNIVVGQEGEYGGASEPGGGGGGSFIYTGNIGGSYLLIAASGGGGGCEEEPWAGYGNGQPGVSNQYGTYYDGTSYGNAGDGGTWGGGGGGGPGAGWYSDGNGENAGTRWNGGNSYADGGFGGGGAGNSSNGGGCGGGFSGGSSYSQKTGGGGGGSYNSGINQYNSSGVNAGHGYVIITKY
jgi:hypothetical protein